MLSKFSVKKPFTVIVTILIVAILGVVSYQNMTVDLLPSMNLPYAIVSTTYIGASPEEVEQDVTKNIEQGMTSISNIKNVNSVSNENFSLVIMEFNDTVNMDTAVIEMREKLDMLSASFPEGVGSSTIMKINPTMMPIMVSTISVKDMSKSEMSAFVKEKIIPDIESVDGVATVSANGLITNMVNIEIDNAKIEKINNDIKTAIMTQMLSSAKPQPTQQNAGASQAMPEIKITNEMLEGMLKGQNFSMPTGTLKEGNISYLVKTGDKIKDLNELKNLVVMSLPIPGFDKVTLADIATVQELDNSAESYSKINGNDGVMLTLSKQADYSTAEVSKSALERLDTLEKSHDGVEFITLMDQGDYVNVVINSIFKNIIVGAILAALVLLLFLKSFRSTFVISISIVISLVTAYVLMYFSGLTLNIISMGGLALGIGMLVDNSIVVIENIYRLRAEGMPAREAAINGARQVSGAIFASTLTTIIVFVPILFTHGFTKQIFMDMGLTISFSLIASLIVALTFVPMMASTVLSKKPIKDNKTFDKLKNGYSRFLGKTLNHKWVVLVIVTVLFASSILSTTLLGKEVLPESDMDNFTATIEFPDTLTKEEVYEQLDKTSDLIRKTKSVKTVGAIYGGSGGMEMGMMGGGASNSASLFVLLNLDRKTTAKAVAEEIRQATKDESFEITMSTNGADLSMLMGEKIGIKVASKDLDQLYKTANQVAEEIAKIDGVIDVDNGIGKQSDELRITVIKDKAIAKGMTVAQVFMQASEILKSGDIITTVSDNNIDYDIYVNKEGSKLSIDDVRASMINTPTNEQVKLSDIATVEKTKGFLSINRDNGERNVTVTADVKDGFVVGDINADIQKIADKIDTPAGTEISIGGQNEMMTDTFKDLFIMMALAIVFIYLVMVAQFQSLLSPLIVMFTIPLAFTGGFFAMLITGTTLSAVSLIGLILLVGVVVNNGIVFVDYTNQLVNSGMAVREALVTAGRDRIRPILLTALTTIFAQIALCVDGSSAADMTRAMAVTSIGGLFYATILTLFLVPTLYELFHKGKKAKKSRKTQKAIAE